MKKKYVLTVLFSVLILGFLFVPLLSHAQVATPLPTVNPNYLPPHPYPSPGSAEFPEPGHYVELVTGIEGGVDPINDVTMQFRTETFRQNMQNIRNEAEQARQNGTASAQYFSELKQRTISALNLQIDHINQKTTQLTTEPSLTDGIGTNIDEVSIPSPVDTAIITLINQLSKEIIDYLNIQLGFAQNAATVEDLQNIADNCQTFVYNADRQTRARSIGSKIMSQRILHFSWNVQNLVVFGNCYAGELARQLDAGGRPQSATLYRTYITTKNPLTRGYLLNMTGNSPFNNDWYLETQLQKDMYHQWLTWETMGGKKEYKLASDQLAQPDCNGLDACKRATVDHMRKGKRILQDLFHLAYWAWDYMLVQKETGFKFDMKSLATTCPLPSFPWGGHSMSSQGSTPGVPTSTPRPRGPMGR